MLISSFTHSNRGESFSVGTFGVLDGSAQTFWNIINTTYWSKVNDTESEWFRENDLNTTHF